MRPHNDSEVRADFLEVGRCLPPRVDGVLASWAVRQSKCHRCVTDAADREVERQAAVKEKSAAERAGAAGVEAPPAVVGVLADAAALGLLECCDADS